MTAWRGACLSGVFLLPAVAGCGPSKEQLLFYELELAFLGFLLLWFLMWLGRRFVDSRVWFVCSFCLKPNARDDVQDGTVAVCSHCGQRTSVNELPPDLKRRAVLEEARTRRSRLWRRVSTRPVVASVLLAVGVQAVLWPLGLASWGLVESGWLYMPGFHEHQLHHEILFPVLFALSAPDWWGALVGGWLFIVCYHALVALGPLAPPLPGSLLLTGFAIALTALWALVIWFGHRCRRRRWVLPAAVGAANAVIAVVAYVTNWEP